MRRRVVTGIMSGVLGLTPTLAQPPQASAPSLEGNLALSDIELVAPAAAIATYQQQFKNRVWVVRVDSREAFVAEAQGVELRPELRDLLLDPRRWSRTAKGAGFEHRPPPDLLLRLTPAERRSLFGFLALWSDNKPERWPLVLPDSSAFDSWLEHGLPQPLVERVRSLCYSFPGGWAFSDFSVLAAEFPDEALQTRFLTQVSRVRATLPRLKLQTALSVSSALAYWTVDHHNAFALPLLEALLESESEDGIELTAIMPGESRVRAFDLSPEDVRHDHAASSYFISSSLAAPPQTVDLNQNFFRWFEARFRVTRESPRYGDVLEMTYRNRDGVPYACAVVARDLVFCRDPVGLGLWRFMRPDEVLSRNPNFEGASLLNRRFVPPEYAP